jgi:hypothetical protein
MSKAERLNFKYGRPILKEKEECSQVDALLVQALAQVKVVQALAQVKV